MQKKIFFRLCLFLGVLGATACSGHNSWWNNGEYEYVPEEEIIVAEDAQVEPIVAEETEVFVDDPQEAAKLFNKRIPPLNSLIVCRDKQCAPAELSMSREYIYNALAQLIDNNLDTTALLCEANAQAHVCVNPYLTVPAKVGVTPAYVFFDGVKFVDASTIKGRTAFDLALGYNLSYNGQTPTVCKPDTAMLYVKSNNSVVLNGKGFKCEMTSVGTTTIRIMFAIDYIDLDYGYIGGYYTIGLSGPAYGGGSGYGLIRLTKDAHPLEPALKAKGTSRAQNPSVRPAIKTPSRPETPAVNPVAPISGGNMAPHSQEPAKQNFSNHVVNDNVNSARPMQTQPVESRAIPAPVQPQMQPQPQQINPPSMPVPQSVYDNEPPAEYEEIYVNDLDEYIK